MGFIIPITEFVTYVLYSILAGYVALQFVPSKNKPTSKMSNQWILLTLLGIYIFSLGPVVQVISYFSESVGFMLATYSVLTDFQVGKAWIITGFLAVFFWMTILLKGSKYIQAILLLLMVLSVGYASHVASLAFWPGLVAHSTHFLAVTLWTGILLHIAWYSKDLVVWAKFLSWFTPFAVICLMFLFVSGFILMFYIVEPKEYISSWVLPYGQMLLLKHISVIPVIFFALINGVLLKKIHAVPIYNPHPWMKAEALFIFITFYFTSVMGTLSPPHEVDFTVKSEGASKWVEWLFGKDILTSLDVGVAPNISSILLLVMAFLFLAMIYVSVKKVKPGTAVFFGISFIFLMYFGLILSLSI
jgi:copper resistance protein D